MNYIDVKNLSVKLGGNLILENVDLSLEKGKVYGFWGRNGSGKTVLLKTIIGFIKPVNGTILIDNKQLYKKIEFPENLGLLIENPGFLNYLSGYENLRILANIRKVISDDDICMLMSKFELDYKDKKSVSKYSLGMKQKLGIIQAIMEKPDLLILDEPTNSLDTKSVTVFKDLINDLKLQGTTILLTSHIKNDLDDLCDTVYNIIDGKLVDSSDE